MSIHLVFLGTGTCNASGQNPSAMALTDGTDVLCVDFGGGAYHQMARLESPLFRYRNISTIALTHFHVDHVSGLPDFFWGGMWDSQGKRTDPLTLVGPPGLAEFYAGRLLPFIGDYEIPFEVELRELSDGELFEGSFYTLKSHKLLHGDNSTGYMLDAGISLGITGDTGYCETLETLLGSCHCAVMEWGIQGSSEYAKHITTDDVLRLLKTGAMPDRVFVTHMYLPPGTGFGEQVRINKEILKDFPVEFLFPKDRDIYTLLP